MSARRLRLALAIVATDATFERRVVRGQELWVGRCIFCNRALTVELDGRLDGRATLEHIQPRHHGGDDRVVNLALACRGCNHEKGVRHDARDRNDPRLGEIIAALAARRRERWREPETVGLGELVRGLGEQPREDADTLSAPRAPSASRARRRSHR